MNIILKVNIITSSKSNILLQKFKVERRRKKKEVQISLKFIADCFLLTKPKKGLKFGFHLKFMNAARRLILKCSVQ